VAIRPEFVYGPFDKHVLSLYWVIKHGLFLIPGNSLNCLQPTFIDDLIRALNLILKKRIPINGEVFIIAGRKPLTVRFITNTIANALGVRRPGRIPYFVALSLGKMGDIFQKIFSINLPINSQVIKFFNQRRAFSWNKAYRLVGYTPQISYKEGIKKTIAFYKKEGLL